MLVVADNLSDFKLGAGEPFLLQVAFQDKNGAAVDISARAFVLSFYKADRSLERQLAGVPDSDGEGQFLRFEEDGNLSESLYGGASLKVELAERYLRGRNVIATGSLTIAATAATVQSLGNGPIGTCATRVVVKAAATPGAAVFSQHRVPWVAQGSAPAPTPAVPVFTTAPSFSPASGTAGATTFTASDGAASNASGYTRRWLLSGTSIGTGTTVTPTAAGSLALEVIAHGPGGDSAPATTAAATVAAAPTLSLSAPIAQAEGNSGTTAFTYTLTLTRNGSTAAIPFAWAVTGTGANPADAADFGGTFPSGSGTFAAGETSKTITVLATGDTAVEPDEAFLLTVTSPGLASVSANGTIVNDDAANTSPVILAVLAGQSNMEGRQNREAQDTDVSHAVQFVGEAAQAGYRTISADITPLRHYSTVADSNNGGAGWLGPGEYIARQLLTDNPTADVVLVPTAKGSTCLASGNLEWRPAASGGGYLFENMIDQANRAYAAVQAAYPGRPIQVCFFWSQGEFDAGNGVSRSTYAAALTDLIARARARVTGAASAPFVIGSLLPQKWTIGASTFDANYAGINAAQVDVSLAVTGVMYSRGPAIAYTGTENDNLHYGPASAVRQYGLNMGLTLSDVAGPTVTSVGATGTNQGSKLALLLTASEPHATFEISGGADAGLFELSDRYLTPTLRYAGNGTGPAAGSYEVKVRARDGSGNYGAVKTIAVTVAAATSGPVTGPSALGRYYVDGTFFSGPTITFPGVSLGKGLNLLYFTTGAGQAEAQGASIPGGTSGTKLLSALDNGGGGNGTVVGIVVASAGTYDVAVPFNGGNGAVGNVTMYVSLVTGTKPAPIDTDYKSLGFSNPPNASKSLTVPADGIAVAFGFMPYTPPPNTGTTLVDGPNSNGVFVAKRTTAGVFSFGGGQGNRQLSALVFEKAA